MDVWFEPTGGKPPFHLDVRCDETIQEVKVNIQNYTRISAEKQTLIFKNQTLPDDLKIEETDIMDNSRIELIIDETEVMPPREKFTTVVGNQEFPTPTTPGRFTDYCTPGSSMENTSPTATATASPSPSPSPSKKISLILRTSYSFLDGNLFEVEDNDTIQVLKEKLREEVHKGFYVEEITVRSNGVEFPDHNTLRECGIFDQSEIQVSFKNMVLTILCGTETISLEVNELDNVGELRNKLENMNRRELLNLSQEGFFFKHKQVVMEEDKSFRWHNVQKRDTIEIIDSSNNTPSIQKIPKALVELKIKVMCGTKTISLEVNESDNVGELRKVLKKMNQGEELNLSEKGFSFKHKQVMMSEDKSFQWHNVEQGDTIEIIMVD